MKGKIFSIDILSIKIKSFMVKTLANWNSHLTFGITADLACPLILLRKSDKKGV